MITWQSIAALILFMHIFFALGLAESPDYLAEKNVKIQGVVVANFNGCPRDGDGNLVLEVNGKIVFVTYCLGRRLNSPCAGIKNYDMVSTLSRGDVVEVYGERKGGDLVWACDSRRSDINKISTSSLDGDVAGRFQRYEVAEKEIRAYLRKLYGEEPYESIYEHWMRYYYKGKALDWIKREIKSEFEKSGAISLTKPLGEKDE